MKEQVWLMILLVGALGGCASHGTRVEESKWVELSDKDASNSITRPDDETYYYGSRMIAPKQGVVEFEPAIRPVIVDGAIGSTIKTVESSNVDSHPSIMAEQHITDISSETEGQANSSTEKQTKVNTAPSIWDRYCTGEILSPKEYEIVDSGDIPEHWIGRCKHHK